MHGKDHYRLLQSHWHHAFMGCGCKGVMSLHHLKETIPPMHIMYLAIISSNILCKEGSVHNNIKLYVPSTIAHNIVLVHMGISQ